MKSLDYHDPYHKSSVTRDRGYQTDNGIIKVIGNYDNVTTELKYITIKNQNDLKIHISKKLIPELIEMLAQYT